MALPAALHMVMELVRRGAHRVLGCTDCMHGYEHLVGYYDHDLLSSDT